MAEHSTKLGHCIQSQDTSIMAMKSRCTQHIREATETELHTDNMSREEGFSLSKLWEPLLETMKDQNKAPFS
jgi:hypothetical protein